MSTKIRIFGALSRAPFQNEKSDGQREKYFYMHTYRKLKSEEI